MNYSAVADQYATAFEANAAECFAVNIAQDTAGQRLNSYVQAANLSESLLYGQGSLNGTNGTTVAMSNSTSGSSGNMTLYALSLSANGTAVEVQHSDLGFTLLYNNNVSESVLRATVEALQPYPKGEQPREMYGSQADIYLQVCSPMSAWSLPIPRMTATRRTSRLADFLSRSLCNS